MLEEYCWKTKEENHQEAKEIGVPLSEETRAAKLESKNSVKVCKINTSIDIITLKPGLLNYCVQDNDDTLERKLNISEKLQKLRDITNTLNFKLQY